MIQFYSSDIEESRCLPEGESAHCCRVLRMKAGDEIFVTDGKGKRYRCEIIKADFSKTELNILGVEIPEKDRPYHLTLAVAPTKNSDRMEWMVEKAVEIGVDRIVLLKCKRSERKVQRSDRLLKVMISAMKQSLATTLPELVELTEYKDFVKGEGKDVKKYFGYCSEDLQKNDFVRVYEAGGRVAVMIGPEGDFSPEEVESAMENGFVPVTFGNKRLRTETAGVFAVSAVNVINQL